MKLPEPAFNCDAKPLTSKTVLMIGRSTGIRLTVAVLAARSGADFLATARDEAKIHAVAAELQHLGSLMAVAEFTNSPRHGHMHTEAKFPAA